MKSYPFEQHRAWQQSRLLAKMIFAQTAAFPSPQGAHLAEQLNACAINVSSNIVESISRKSSSGQRHYSRIAQRSLLDALNLMLLAIDMGYIPREAELSLRQQIDVVDDAMQSLGKS